MRRQQAALLVTSILLLGTSACSWFSEAAPGPSTPGAVYTGAPYVAPPDDAGATVLLEQEHTGSHVFDLPTGGDHPALHVGGDCGEEHAGQSLTIGIGDDRSVWQMQFTVPCAGAGGGASVSYPAAELPGAPTRLYVTTGDDVHHAVRVWGSDSPVVVP
ncbi:hypothetical protein [Modestobacter sp. VKM Ac-2985]|uniref:hypothetical protein n=1 Tax=Modestobacter sp. VKM Ac-2985 TaxID=3004139 RepID=UPI0022AB6A3C|nr:hypothetical protein [Modestobacter sp. VKM Ac-2985]MCZ2839018.1 hypothetical protein [Modestobacter sp. VKM Ac-2985]